ncbi:cytidyltransferase [Sulfolobus acidocaldarius SUSAZ]|nr:cytidyltransferase [Sulfolobus acidocaldarius SUSAZ]
MVDEIADRVRRYIQGMEDRLSKIPPEIIQKYEKIYNLAKLYVEDAKYYLNLNDKVTALVDVVYAEGLLDAIIEMEKLDIERQVSKRVFVAGTFDILHPGHIAFLREASKYGRVYVAVARDKNSEKIKGRKPINDENQRLEVIKSVKYVYDAFLGDEKDFLKSVERVKPNIIVLGPDQKVDEQKLIDDLKNRGVIVEKIVRIPSRINNWAHSSTSSIINEVLKRYCNST